MARKNPTVETSVRATRIVVENGRAAGAEILRQGSARPETVRARREVIVSAGAINSPKLLLLSGIGPADELKARGVRLCHGLRFSSVENTSMAVTARRPKGVRVSMGLAQTGEASSCPAGQETTRKRRRVLIAPARFSARSPAPGPRNVAHFPL
jgi:choline dehydrogenase-like flavoprotein